MAEEKFKNIIKIAVNNYVVEDETLILDWIKCLTPSMYLKSQNNEKRIAEFSINLRQPNPIELGAIENGTRILELKWSYLNEE